MFACPLVAMVLDDEAAGPLNSSTLRNTSTYLPSILMAASLRGSSSTSNKGKSAKKSSDRLVEAMRFRRSVSKNFLMGGWKLGGGCSPRRIASSQCACAFFTAASAEFGLFWPWCCGCWAAAFCCRLARVVWYVWRMSLLRLVSSLSNSSTLMSVVEARLWSRRYALWSSRCGSLRGSDALLADLLSQYCMALLPIACKCARRRQMAERKHLVEEQRRRLRETSFFALR